MVELVALRTFLRARQHGHQSQHRSHVASTQRSLHPQTHPLGHLRCRRSLQCLFLFYIRFPMYPDRVLLDKVCWRDWQMSRYLNRGRCHVRLLGSQLRRRPDLCYATGIARVVFADGRQREDSRHRDPGARWNVSISRLQTTGPPT
jgi:hypothetical protein